MKIILLLLNISLTLHANHQNDLPSYPSKNIISEIEKKELYFKTLQIKTLQAKKEVCNNELLSGSWLLAEYFLNFENHQVSQLYFFPNQQPLFILRTFQLDEDQLDTIDFDFYTNKQKTKINRIMVKEFEKIADEIILNDMEKPQRKKENLFRLINEETCIQPKTPKPENIKKDNQNSAIESFLTKN